jgi:transcriptional regulator with GAF, ATPase, and Fis domain
MGSSPAMLRLSGMVRRVAKRDITVLLTGETGTGKEVIAQAVHRLSPRAGRPFVTVNCAAIPEALLESELFGYVRGAFTGAVQSRMGRLHTAHGGVLFLDEIGEMPMGLQAKLLRFLESGEVQRLGSPDLFRVDVRVIAATNAALKVRIAERQFREDLYYRLAVFPIELPPLRSRGTDVLILARHFLEHICGRAAAFDESSERWLLSQGWRGNVRELRHCIERASVLWEGEGPITVQHLQI